MKKKFITLVTLLSAGSTLMAQTLPNPGMENWTNYGLYEDPQGWASLNILSVMGAPESVSQSTTAHSGTYSAQIESVIFDIDNNNSNDTIPGILSLGYYDLMNDEMVDGAPCSVRVSEVTGWYQYTTPSADKWSITISMTKWNTATNEADEIGSGYLENDASAAFTAFSAPITYTSNAIPDSIHITILNTTYSSGAGNILRVDDLGLQGQTAGITEAEALHLSIHPNPVSGQLTLSAAETIEAEIMRINGQAVQNITIVGSTPYILDTRSWDNGIYLVRYASGQTKRFIVAH